MGENPDGAEYEAVGGCKKKKRPNGSDEFIDVTSYDVDNQNRYSIFADMKFSDTHSIPNKHNVPNKRIINTEEVSTPAIATAAHKKFCPPIFIFDQNINNLAAQLEARTPKIFFKIKNINRRKSKIYFTDPAVHSEMMSVLRQKKVNSYSFTPKEFKQMSFVLRGLDFRTSADEVKEKLDEEVPGVVAKVSTFSTPHSIKNNYDTGLFLVTLHPGKDRDDIKHIKAIAYQIVTWEKPNNKQKEMQCRRCQHWGHIAKNCNAEFQCVKCDQKHEPGNCQRVAQDGSQPTCVNCGEVGHPANWKGCKSYKTYVESKRQRILKAQEVKEIARNNVRRFTSSYVSPGKPFASLFSKNPTNNNTGQKSVVEEFMKLASYFMEPEELTIEQELEKFLREFRLMSKSDAKAEFLRLYNKIKNVP